MARELSGNFFQRVPERLEEEEFLTLAQGGGCRVERIVSTGQSSPEGFWYDQEEHEWVMVLKGRAGLEFEGEDGVTELGPGDFRNIPAHCRHRVAWTSSDEPTVWIAVFYPAEGRD